MKLILERDSDYEGWTCYFIAELLAKQGTQEDITYYQIFRHTRQFRYKDYPMIQEPGFQLKVLDTMMKEGWAYMHRYLDDYIHHQHWFPNGIIGQSPFTEITEQKLPLIWWVE